MKSYLDASALAKNYVEETGSRRIEELLASSDEAGTTVICLLEVVSALCRAVRDRRLEARDYELCKAHFLADWADLDVVAVSDLVCFKAIELLERQTLRASDALHVASALAWEADVFVSSDARQLEAARRAGLTCTAV